MKRPYIKKYKIVKGYSVYIVDGTYIRDNINEEFTNFGINPRFKFIPKKELWIDKEYGKKDEIEFYLKNLLDEEELIKKGIDYDTAFENGDKIEKRLRKRYEEKKKNHYSKKELLKKLHIKLIKKYSKKIKVWIVEGDLVRDYFFIDFTEGGHDYVYDFVPKNEVWIDDDLNPKERGFVILHEIHERNLMKKGKDYNSAHKSASKIEHHCRKNPKILAKRIKEELDKIEK
jgi:hypothetical protein